MSRTGAFTLKVSCPVVAVKCSGTVSLRTLSAVIAKKSKATILTVASGSFSVAGGHVTTITLHLSSKARALLARSHVIRVRATIVAHNSSGAHTTISVLTLRPAKVAKHK